MDPRRWALTQMGKKRKKVRSGGWVRGRKEELIHAAHLSS